MHRWILWTGMQRLDNHGRLGDVDSDYEDKELDDDELIASLRKAN